MSTTTTRPPADPNLYPDDDGNPLAENTLQFKWIVLVKENLESVFRFKTYKEIQGEAEAAKQDAAATRQAIEAADQRAEAERRLAERLAARLRELGESID